jgi:asparagine synthase (glutamine-hydrolysing)
MGERKLMKHFVVNTFSQQTSVLVPFLALGAGDFSPEFFGERIRICLDGRIQVNGQPLSDTKGPSRDLIVETLSDHYRTKGEEFLKDVSGSFRLALWDSEERKLILAVDPFATRPIYYTSVNGMLVFAPRISCLSTLPEIVAEIDLNVIYFYLNHSFIPAPFTVYRDIHRMEPGQYLLWQDRRLTLRQYWDIQYHEDPTLSVKTASELLSSAVGQSVGAYISAQSCNASGLGAFLSGGTDSSTLVGLMSKLTGDRINTFSVGFSEEQYNEIDYARVAALQFDAKAHEYFVSADEALETLPVIAAQFDEPFGNSSAIPAYFCLRMAKDTGVNVMFAGDGGDELFAGNSRYADEKLFLPFDILPPPLQVAAKRIAGCLPGIVPLSKIRRYIERAGEPNPERVFFYQLFLDQHCDEFFSKDFAASIDRGFALQMPRLHYQKAISAAPLNRLLYIDLKMCIADNDLFKVNRMAEALGVTVCYPYLDKNLAEITGKIPAALKLKGFQKRFIFKKAFENLLPQEILKKPKHGFGLPVARWLRSHAGFRELARSLLLDACALQRGYFRRGALEELLRKHDAEESDFYGTFVWNAMMLELWHRNYRDKRPAKGMPGASGLDFEKSDGSPDAKPNIYDANT